VAATWRCAAVGGFKGEALHSAAFCADGSLMALGGTTSVTLWEPSANNHVATLALPPNAGAPVRAPLPSSGFCYFTQGTCEGCLHLQSYSLVLPPESVLCSLRLTEPTKRTVPGSRSTRTTRKGGSRWQDGSYFSISFLLTSRNREEERVGLSSQHS
jgi:hypothetical protein